jgi:hypothetical protein
MIFRQRVWLVVTILLIFSVGCSAFGAQLPPESGQDAREGEAVSQDPGGEGEEQELPSLPDPNPINVSVTTEDEASAGATADPEEDLIFSTTDSKGIVYTLKIPAGALLSPEDIRMTPVSEMQGLPEGASMAAAVHLEPEGLIFLQSATLAVEFPEDMSTQDLYALSTMANGKEAHLTPFRRVGQQFIMPIHHFSSPSLTRMEKETVIRVLKENAPSDIGRSTVHQISEEVDLENPENTNREAAYSYILKWHRDGLMPLIREAHKNSDLLENAVAEFVRWQSLLADLKHAGIVETEFAYSLWRDTKEELAVAFIHAYEDLADKCREENDPVQAARMFRLSLLVLKLDFYGYLHVEGFTSDRIFEQYEGCLSFLMHFESYLDIQTDLGRWSIQITDFNADFDLPEMDTIDMTDQVYTMNLRAQSELNYNVLKVTPDSDQCVFWGEPGTAEYRFEMDANLNETMNFPASVDLAMEIPEIPTEKMDCADEVPPSVSPSWITIFWGEHADKANVGFKGPYEFTVPIVSECSGGTCVYAEESWPAGEGSAAVSGKTEITIFHTP